MAFVVHSQDKVTKFTKIKDGLYCYKPRGPIQQGSSFFNSVEENKKLHSSREVSQAKVARDLYHTLGTPSIKDFKAILCMNCIKNNPVTIKDVQLAEKIFGPDIGSIKGRTTHSKPALVCNAGSRQYTAQLGL